MQVTMVGHSTVLIETAGKRILTDPYFFTWGNPAYERLNPPGLSREDLRDIDLVLLSHNHFDHVDTPFFRGLPASVPVVSPRQTAILTRLQGAQTVVGVLPWENRTVAGIDFTAVPASHSAVTVGFVLQSEGRCVYFAGDTYYRPFMQDIGIRFKLDLAFLPVTTFRLPMTMGEDDAVRAVRDLQPAVVIPIHLGIRPRSPLMRTDQTWEGFAEKVHQAGLSTNVVHLREGEIWNLPTRSEIK